VIYAFAKASAYERTSSIRANMESSETDKKIAGIIADSGF
jgi:hypothetical protein